MAFVVVALESVSAYFPVYPDSVTGSEFDCETGNAEGKKNGLPESVDSREYADRVRWLPWLGAIRKQN